MPTEITSDDLQLLRTRAEGDNQYCHVYQAKRQDMYEARIFKVFYLGSYPNPTEAARAVIRWFQAFYGENWKDVIRGRKANTIMTYSNGAGKWLAYARFWGESHRVRLDGKCLFDSRKEAKRAGREWAKREIAERTKKLIPLFLFSRRRFRPSA